MVGAMLLYRCLAQLCAAAEVQDFGGSKVVNKLYTCPEVMLKIKDIFTFPAAALVFLQRCLGRSLYFVAIYNGESSKTSKLVTKRAKDGTSSL